ncbi:MAG: 50S ribosomal protein L23 [Tenericutes bacterium]|jgi:large subunit ribosomal protein L23|nr:50S ribosomal protein L23 [Bacilli bacterium]MDD3995263.1 50S ribosomal protein L23 [Bacilli bacterium]MDD4623852.1 50S ribosomal protein L23 [Bacilli bacterium]MDD4831298.1 50S ribosomal protein L23 [Bacilli bacterium]NLV90382.1 50S ribosomal protein L23 [Mycoplasmatota bacterium]
MSEYRDLIKAPIITEKSASIASNDRKYVFEVDSKANKTQIKQAIEKIFKVKVEKVNTINVVPKKKRVGRYSGFTNHYKKAVITLAPNNKIDL